MSSSRASFGLIFLFWVIVELAPAKEHRLLDVRYQPSAAIPAALLRARPVLPLRACLGANVRESAAEDLPRPALSGDEVNRPVVRVSERPINFQLRLLALVNDD